MTKRLAALLLGASAVAGCMSSGHHGHQLGGGNWAHSSASANSSGGARTSVTSGSSGSSHSSGPSRPSSWRSDVRASSHRHDPLLSTASHPSTPSTPGTPGTGLHVRDHRDHGQTTAQTDHGTLDAILGIAEDLVPAVAEALLTSADDDLVADRGADPADPMDPTATIVDPCETCPLEDPCGACTGYAGSACRDNASGVMSRCESSSAPNLRVP